MTNAFINKVISNVREDLAAHYGAAFSDDVFDAVLQRHLAEATITDFVPVLVEAEMVHLLDHHLVAA
ncbi:hypothetical protein G7Y29_09815 [Corynebacterium qintianiae]|uniref:Transposase n=1 Tax=Corynebacterium qintianiae TaxID=2709392 RepID=A0A7T0PET0_9CORY|nr:hypothetical protein [Corynebacterium qintianiae]QPK83115.1 hypothetical protein G7Y29_09815 [Corynebacterium qintianiae]